MKDDSNNDLGGGDQSQNRFMRVVANVVLVALLLGGLAIAGRWGWCLRKVDGESIGGFPAETFGEYQQAVSDESGGCTKVNLIDSDGLVVDNPDPGTPIKPVTGELLSEPIDVFEK